MGKGKVPGLYAESPQLSGFTAPQVCSELQPAGGKEKGKCWQTLQNTREMQSSISSGNEASIICKPRCACTTALGPSQSRQGRSPEHNYAFA